MDIRTYKKFYPKKHLGNFARSIINKLVNHDSVAIYGVKASGRHFVLRHIRAYLNEYTKEKWIYVESNAKILEGCNKETLSYAICNQIVDQIPKFKEYPFSDSIPQQSYVSLFYTLIEKCNNSNISILFLIHHYEYWLKKDEIIEFLHALNVVTFIRFPLLLASDISLLLDKNLQKTLPFAQNVVLIPPLEDKDVEKMIRANTKIFNWKFNADILSKCKRYSGNNPGFVKYLHRLLSEHPKFTTSEILKDETIRNKCESHVEELRRLLNVKEITYNILFSDQYSEILQKAGYLVKGKIFSPLFEKYIRQNGGNKQTKDTELAENLPRQEYDIFIKMKKDTGKIFSYEDIATIMWQDNSKEKFSLWAIYQIMASLRKLLRNSNYVVKTVRRRGYKLTQRET